MKRHSQGRRLKRIALAGLLAAVAAFGALGLFVVKMRRDALADASTNASNLASILAEQVDRTIDALDTSLRTTVRLLEGAETDSLPAFARRPDFVNELALEQRQLSPARLFGIADAEGLIVSGAHGAKYANVNIADRADFKELRDSPGQRLVVSKPVQNRATGAWMIFLARRLETRSGQFLGIVFIGVEPWKLLQTSHAITSVAGQSFALFDNDGHMLVRHPEPTQHKGIGERIAVAKWYEISRAGGGSYHSSGFYDGKPKTVAVRPIVAHPFVISTSITDEGALTRWRTRAVVVAATGFVALAIIGALIFFVIRMRENLARAEVRAWLRQKRTSANAEMRKEIRERFGATLDYVSQGMAMFDDHNRLLAANGLYESMYNLEPGALKPGMSAEEIYKLRVAAGIFEGSADVFLAAKPTERPYERIDRLSNGRILHVRSKPTGDGGFVALHEDVTERTLAGEKLAYIALHDRLTGLPNREGFRQELERAAAACVDHDADGCVVVLVDIDEFKTVNDIYGHEIGDRVLVELATRLAKATPEAYLARLGGDEFLAFVKASPGAPADPRDIGERLAATLREPFACDGRDIKISASMGVLALGSRESSLRKILRRVDLALAAAKKQGTGGRVLFDPKMEDDFDARVGLAEQLREAIAGNQLETHYQPIVDAHDGSIICMEALVRWRHPINGMISPAVFIPLAEESGSIVELGEWVMRRACLDAVQWPGRTIVAVNVSSLQIARPTFADEVEAILKETGLPPSRLQIEITESVLLHNDTQIVEELNALRDLGVTFALDDFGTGYASLGYLKDFPVDKIKVDKSFVDDICVKPQLIAIVSAAVVLARGLSIEVTAEGVETREQFETLRALGVASMQGYYFGRPRPIAEQDFKPLRALAA